MVRKVAPRFVTDKLKGFDWLDPDVTNQFSIFQGMDKEELQEKVGHFLWADHVVETEKYEVAAPKDWERVCRRPEDSRSFYIYDFLLTRLEVRLPFMDF